MLPEHDTRKEQRKHQAQHTANQHASSDLSIVFHCRDLPFCRIRAGHPVEQTEKTGLQRLMMFRHIPQLYSSIQLQSSRAMDVLCRTQWIASGPSFSRMRSIAGPRFGLRLDMLWQSEPSKWI